MKVSENYEFKAELLKHAWKFWPQIWPSFLLATQKLVPKKNSRWRPKVSLARTNLLLVSQEHYTGIPTEISNGHKLKDLDETFKALEKVAKAEICERKIWSSTLSSRTQNYLCIPNVETYNDMRQKRN